MRSALFAYAHPLVDRSAARPSAEWAAYERSCCVAR
jgi:hypothetical protein